MGGWGGPLAASPTAVALAQKEIGREHAETGLNCIVQLTRTVLANRFA